MEDKLLLYSVLTLGENVFQPRQDFCFDCVLQPSRSVGQYFRLKLLLDFVIVAKANLAVLPDMLAVSSQDLFLNYTSIDVNDRNGSEDLPVLRRGKQRYEER